MLPIFQPEIVAVRDFAELGDMAADFFMKTVQGKKNPVIVPPTGNTPKSLYAALSDRYKDHPVWQTLRVLQLDEYLDLTENDERSFAGWVARELLDRVGHPPAYRWTFNACADPHAEAQRMQRLLEEAVPRIDLLILGLGHNGHIGFNEPGTSFGNMITVQDLTPETIAANASYWGSADRVPARAITLGLRAFRRAAQTLLLVSGEAKNEALHRALRDPVSEAFPATYIRTLPNVTVMADYAALGIR